MEKALRVVCGRDVCRLHDHARFDRGRVLGRDGVRDRRRHDNVGVDLEPAFPRQLKVARPQRGAVDLAQRGARPEQQLNVETVGVCHRAVDIDDADDPGPEPGQIPGARAAHRAEALHDGAELRDVPSFVLGGRGRGFGHAVAADAVGEPDALDVDGKALADSPARGLRVSRAVEHRLHGHADALLGEYLVQQLLADPEVFGRAPTVAIEGPHGTYVPREQPAGLRVVRIDVDAALGAATR